MVLALILSLATQAPPLTADETRDFMKRLATYVEQNHLKKDPRSEQQGMIYEYFDVKRKGQPDQWVQGEALDTMHDGSWFCAALVSAARSTHDPYYKDLLTRASLPFYCKMLNHSDTLFNATRDDVDAKGHTFGKEHQVQAGEKGFVPYWWDDGASVSLERRRTKILQPDFSATDRLRGKPNPNFALDGWSHGSSNHLAQDLGLMLQQTWLLLRESDPKLAAEVAEAAKNLQACRMNHFGYIPAVVAACALTQGDKELMKKVPGPRDLGPSNHYTNALAPKDATKSQSAPGFADDAEYHYHYGVAKAGGELPRALALELIYDAYTHPMLYRYYSDNAPAPPGINGFDLAPYAQFVGGKPTVYRSTRVTATGSRFGPQNMVVCGWALQALKAYPGIWEERYAKQFASDLRVGYEGYSDAVAGVRLASTRDALRISGAKDRSFRVYSQPDAKGSYAEVVVKDGKAVATNDAGEALLIESKGDEFLLPYTVVKNQKPWANGIEHFRYTVAVGDTRRNFYLASSEAQVTAALTRELGEGLRTWRGIFEEKGYIPTGDGAGWSQFSDAGGYAHLVSAASQWLFVLDGKRDWEVHKYPRPE
jgi:hypothetical protein